MVDFAGKVICTNRNFHIGLFLSTATAAQHHHHSAISSCILSETKFSNCYLEHISHKQNGAHPSKKRVLFSPTAINTRKHHKQETPQTRDSITNHRRRNGNHRRNTTVQLHGKMLQNAKFGDSDPSENILPFPNP